MVPLPKHRISAGSLHTSITQGRVATDSLALLPPLPFSFPPSRLLGPAELCARRLGPLVRHLDNSGFIRDRKVSKKSERWFGEVEIGVARLYLAPHVTAYPPGRVHRAVSPNQNR